MVLTAQKDPADSRPTAAMQGSLFGAGQVQCGSITARPTVLDPGSTVTFQPGWLQGSQTLFDQLTKDMPWKAMQRPMYDRMVNVPRLICTLSTSELTTADPLLLITGELERHVGGAFSSIGLNLYRDGNDSVAWHRDSLGRSGVPTTVVLVALGSPRTLAMRPYRNPASNLPKPAETTGSTPATRVRWYLGHGDLLIMDGQCQHRWEHCVPKERSVGPRISLAFRR